MDAEKLKALAEYLLRYGVAKGTIKEWKNELQERGCRDGEIAQNAGSAYLPRCCR